MSCTNCGQQSNIKTLPTGCHVNGSSGTLSCDKLTVFDWLGNLSLPSNQKTFNVFEVRFKNGRKAYYKNVNDLALSAGEAIAVESSPGHDIGTISLSGELVKLQLAKRKITHDSEDIKKIYRKATQKDIDIWQNARSKETNTQREARLIIGRLGLKMKLSDVEYQGDDKKATFFYTADTRVDFRQLIRDLAAAFKVRIEMKQVDLRHEASRLGGIGSCGRELCCSTWLTDFRRVNTQAARYQQLSLSPHKLQGQCGRLKCCLNFELDSYLDALKSFPDTKKILKTEKGIARFIKMDIFKELLWYAYDDKEDFKWYQLTTDQVHEIIELNKQGKKADSLSDIEIVEDVKKVNFEDAVGEDSLTRFDKPKKKKQRSSRKNRQNKQSKTHNKNNKQDTIQKQNIKSEVKKQQSGQSKRRFKKRPNKSNNKPKNE
jgi:cell fate regulator YaaT (PSP1 superfamily)